MRSMDSRPQSAKHRHDTRHARARKFTASEEREAHALNEMITITDK
ncbi:hypothetical protein V1498_04210 [Peribacillus sp. SCS-26]